MTDIKSVSVKAMYEDIKQFAERIANEKNTLVAAAIAAGHDPMKIKIVYGPGIRPNVMKVWLEED